MGEGEGFLSVSSLLPMVNIKRIGPHKETEKELGQLQRWATDEAQNWKSA